MSDPDDPEDLYDSDESVFHRSRTTKYRRRLKDADSNSSDAEMDIDDSSNTSESNHTVEIESASSEGVGDGEGEEDNLHQDCNQNDQSGDINVDEVQNFDEDGDEVQNVDEDGDEVQNLNEDGDEVQDFDEDENFDEDRVIDEVDDNNADGEDVDNNENGNFNEDFDISEDYDNGEDDNDGPTFAFAEGALDQPLVPGGNKTVKEALVLDLALSMRHNWTYESLLGNFSVKNLLFDSKLFPTSKQELFRILGRKESGMVAYVYCDCGNLIGKKNDLAGVVICACGKDVIISKAKVFYTLSLRQQFLQFLQTPGVPDLLKYRENRTKQSVDAIEDVFDGARYKELQQKMKMSAFDFTFNVNTDGCKIGRGAKQTIYPVFARVNELPPSVRQKFIFLVGIFGDKVEPNMESFLSPIVDEMNDIAKVGVEWYTNGDRNGERHVSHFYTLCFCVDGKACYQIMNMVNYAADYACSSCTFKGVNIDKTQRYPAMPHPLVPHYEERTHAEIVRDMWKAYHHPEQSPVHGIKGLSALLALENFDLVKGKGFDDLHFLYECASKHHFELLLKVAPRMIDPNTGKRFSYAVIERTVDARLRKIRTPSKIARKASNMKLKNRDSFTGTEWRNILLYYAVPCLEGLIKPTYIKHFGMLSEAAHILSRDVIYPQEIDKAEKLIDKYLILFEQYFGIERTRLNMHCLKHAAQSVRNLGPLWCYSTFNFESWNHKLLTKVTSSKDPLLQIIMRHFMGIFLAYLCSSTSEELSDEVKKKCVEILKMKKLRSSAVQVEEHVYVLGKESEERPPSAIEREIFDREELPVSVIKIYDKILINGCEYQSRASVKADALSDNSMIFSKQNTFCTIDKVLVCEDNEGNKTAGLLVFEHDVLPQQHHHICALCPQVFDLLHFVPSRLVKCPIVQIPLNDVLHVAPMPNTFEID